MHQKCACDWKYKCHLIQKIFRMNEDNTDSGKGDCFISILIKTAIQTDNLNIDMLSMSNIKKVHVAHQYWSLEQLECFTL